jgi:hypothetical protein
MATAQRTQTPAEVKWSENVNREHLPPVVIRVFIQLGAAAPGADRIGVRVASIIGLNRPA